MDKPKEQEKPKKTVQKDVESGEDMEIVCVQKDDPRTVIHLGWKTRSIVLRTTQDVLDAQKEKDPKERTAWIKQRMRIEDGTKEWSEIKKEVEELYKAIFVD